MIWRKLGKTLLIIIEFSNFQNALITIFDTIFLCNIQINQTLASLFCHIYYNTVEASEINSLAFSLFFIYTYIFF